MIPLTTLNPWFVEVLFWSCAFHCRHVKWRQKRADAEVLCLLSFARQSDRPTLHIFSSKVQRRWSRNENGQWNDLLHPNSTCSRWNENCQREWCYLRCCVFSANAEADRIDKVLDGALGCSVCDFNTKAEHTHTHLIFNLLISLHSILV